MAGIIPILLFTATLAWASSTGAGTSRTVNEHKPLPLAFLDKEFVNYGKASWYGLTSQGKPTASGRTFDRETFTAAHPSLPFGTVVRVYNLVNKKQVLVTITDRGPFAKSRVLDLSMRAAKNLNMTRSGVVPVIMEVVADPEGRPLNSNNGFYLRLANAPNAAEAHRESARLKDRLNRDIRVLTPDGQGAKGFELCVGPFGDFSEAEKAVDDVEPDARVKDIIEGPAEGSRLPDRIPPPKMAVGADGLPRRIVSSN